MHETELGSTVLLGVQDQVTGKPIAFLFGETDFLAFKVQVTDTLLTG